MKCNNCNFNNLGVEFIDINELDEGEELNCENCNTDLKPQLVNKDKYVYLKTQAGKFLHCYNEFGFIEKVRTKEEANEFSTHDIKTGMYEESELDYLEEENVYLYKGYEVEMI